MKKIKLTKDLEAIVDDDDFVTLNQWNWCADTKGYAVRSEKRSETGDKQRKMILMHRQIVGAPSNKQVDHINGDPLDNRKENLRICTHAENMRNRKLQSNNKTGYKGVWLNKKTGKFVATIKINGISKTIGRFSSPEEAGSAYDRSALKHYKNFARINHG